MPPVFCFIDDSAFELDVFARGIATSASQLEFILASTYDEVKQQLDGRYPCLFLLDLYGRDPSLTDTGIMGRTEIEAKVKSFGDISSVYRELDQFSGDKTNEFLKRLYHITDPWRQLFHYASRKAGQNTKYGLNNLSSVHRDFPAAATVAYTRKSMIMDAVDVISAGADGLNLKPDGPSDEAILAATIAAAPVLLESWSDKVTHSFTRYLQSLVVLLVRSGLGDEVANLKSPANLSSSARDLVGPGEMEFLRTAEEWWAYSGMQPLV